MKILRLWGIPICKILSDTEFVDRSRTGLRCSGKLVWVYVGGLALLALFIPWFVDFVWRMIGEMPDGAEKWAWTGLVLGCIFGALLSRYIIGAVQAGHFDNARPKHIFGIKPSADMRQARRKFDPLLQRNLTEDSMRPLFFSRLQ